MSKRRVARELVVQYLYQIEIRPTDGLKFDDLMQSQDVEDPEIKVFASELLEGISAKKEELDDVIKKYADNWDISRLAVVDKNVLRMALYEIIFREDIPSVVSINEAIEIAKKFSTHDSGKFVNGILDKAREELSSSSEERVQKKEYRKQSADGSKEKADDK